MNEKGSKEESFNEVDSLANAIVENLKEEYESDRDSFDLYTKKIHMNLHQNIEKFRDRFQKGYQVLLNELSKEKEK